MIPEIKLLCGLLASIAVSEPLSAGARVFVNWESPHVHPLDITPDRTRLLGVNTADARLEVFDISRGAPVFVGAIPVGLDPVSVRSRTGREAWVVNRVSGSVSVVDLLTMTVVATIRTANEPADVVFAGEPVCAYVSCSQGNTVEIFDVTAPYTHLASIAIEGAKPRAMATSADGHEVYVAIFESGNRTTILSSRTVSDRRGPYSGQNPPPNAAIAFDPPISPDLLPAPPVALIVKKNADGRWVDDNHGDWTELVSGSLSSVSDRVPGWDMPDHDVAVIDTKSNSVRYATGLMNICMAIAVNPASGQLTVVGTDATNQIRFEPVLQGRFLRVEMARVTPPTLDSVQVVDLNPHLAYSTPTVPQSERDKSLGDPRAIVWNVAGSRGYVAGMGSNNVIVVGADGSRVGRTPAIDVGEGPTGLALDEARNRLYVLNRFEASISVVDAVTESEISRVPFFDPSPIAIKIGRRHLYNTHKTSGLGHISCASCHVDARIDRLAWDLGNPSGEIKMFDQNCMTLPDFSDVRCEDWHPMKGPLTTQTLQDIIGKEPLHWRGDRDGLEEFNAAFMHLLGDDEMLTVQEMQEFKDFLATITIPPNPFRNFDNTLPIDVPLPGHYSIGRFSPVGQPLPNGNAVNGLQAFRNNHLDRGNENCVTCHTLPTGVGTNYDRGPVVYQPLPPGPNGELHHAVRKVIGVTANSSRKIPQLRNLYEKVGFETTQSTSRNGFGFFYDGSMELTRFLSTDEFKFKNDQELADMIAFLMSFSGSDLPVGSALNPDELPGPMSQDTHAAVGRQVTLDETNHDEPANMQMVTGMIALADAGKIGLVVKGTQSDQPRGYAYTHGGVFQSDRKDEQLTFDQLLALAADGTAFTFTVVPTGTETRVGVDRDEDGYLDRDELDACSDPADPASLPGSVLITGDFDGDGRLSIIDTAWFASCMAGPGTFVNDRCRCAFDFSARKAVDLTDFAEFQVRFGN